MRELLAAIGLLPRYAPSSNPDAGAALIECPDGIVVYYDDGGIPLPGVEFDKHGTPLRGGEFIACGRQFARNGACRRCGGRSWVPAAPPASAPADLAARRVWNREREVMRLVAHMD